MHLHLHLKAIATTTKLSHYYLVLDLRFIAYLEDKQTALGSEKQYFMVAIV